jgi:uncharacterized membrane protein
MTAALTPADREVAGARPSRGRHQIRPLSRAGLAVALVSGWLSLTPSLLPRGWLHQGLITGVSVAAGYALGWLVGRLVRVRPRPWHPRAWRLSFGVAAVVTALAFGQGWIWQRDIHRLMGQQPEPPAAYTYVLLVSVLVFAVLLAAARGLGALVRLFSRLFGRWVQPRAARIAAFATVAVVATVLLDGMVSGGFMSVAASISQGIDERTPAGVRPPTDPARSGSPASLVRWDSLGMQGRMFVAGGPTRQRLRQFSGIEPKEPIRVYAGLHSAATVVDDATLVVRELRRTGAFDRKVLCVVITTGTGWVDPRAASTLEYMYNGDTAIVGLQYSYLPSWLTFLTQRDQIGDAARVLFNRVHDEWANHPAGRRPMLLVFGESLGSMGAEAVFSSLADLRSRTDGALWIGPTDANPIWRELTAHRDPGTPEVLPVYQGGAAVRFASGPADLARGSAAWQRPRVVYLQHGSDPINWWSPALLLHRPDWLKEPRAPDVLPAMRWYPFVTFCQVTADVDGAHQAPVGYGHRYDDATIAAWAAIAAPPGWTAARTEQLTRIMAPRT